MFFQVNVDWVSPIAHQVRQEPLLHAVLLHGEAEGLRRLAARSAVPVTAIHELAVDGPLSVQAIELECAHDSWRNIGAGKLVERRVASRVHAVVRDLGTGYLELQVRGRRRRQP